MGGRSAHGAATVCSKLLTLRPVAAALKNHEGKGGAMEAERGRQLRRPHYLSRLRSHASLISKTAIVTMVVSTIGPANIATSVSIFQRGGWRPTEESHSCICEAVSACRARRIILSRSMPGGVPLASCRRRSASWARRSLRVRVCVKWRRFIGAAPFLEEGRERNWRSHHR